MKNYKRIGDYIRLVDERNAGLKVSNLLGLTIAKTFIPSVANTIGADMENYKIIRRNQFACSTMQVRRDGKMPVALLTDTGEAIISQVYPVFEVIDENQLLPEYLMMWFSRKEFDREACFYAIGGVRGSLEWVDFCDMRLPVPSIEKQREIVAEYHVIQNRINLNNQLIQTLEATVQAIYKQWFVDFEFPDAEGKPYISNGGEMVESEMGEVPKGWRVKPFTEVVKISGGGTPSTDESEYWNGSIPFFTPADISNSYYAIFTEKSLTEAGLKNCSSKLYNKNTIFVTARGTVGAIALAGCDMAMNQSCYAFIGENPCYAHQLTIDVVGKLKNEAIGAVFSALITKDFELQSVLVPNINVCNQFEQSVKSIYDSILNKEQLNQQLNNFKELLLSKMATIENNSISNEYLIIRNSKI